jgi:hypothetical protein
MCKNYINSIIKTPTRLRLPFFLIEWSNSTAEGKWGDKLSCYWPTTDPNVKCNNFSKQTTKNKQAACFSSPPRPRRPSSSISIDGEGLGACPHLEIQIWAAAEVASGAIPHYSRTDIKKQASSSFLTSRSLPPPLLIYIDRQGGFRSMPTSGKPDMGCRRSGRWGRHERSMKNRPGKPGRHGGWLWDAIFLDRRGRKRLTQRWQVLALAGGDGRSHGSCGHHGDGVLCWSTSWFFGFGREER